MRTPCRNYMGLLPAPRSEINGHIRKEGSMKEEGTKGGGEWKTNERVESRRKVEMQGKKNGVKSFSFIWISCLSYISI